MVFAYQPQVLLGSLQHFQFKEDFLFKKGLSIEKEKAESHFQNAQNLHLLYFSCNIFNHLFFYFESLAIIVGNEKRATLHRGLGNFRAGTSQLPLKYLGRIAHLRKEERNEFAFS